MKILTLFLILVSGIVLAADKPSIAPLAGMKRGDVRAGYGKRLHPVLHVERMHQGIDFDVPEGTNVVATAPGKVITAASTGGYGLLVAVKHAGGYITKYAHLSTINVRKGETIAAGTVVGHSGNTGESVHEHLHYEVWKNGKSVNPLAYLPK